MMASLLAVLLLADLAAAQDDPSTTWNFMAIGATVSLVTAKLLAFSASLATG
jgi:hypothetical protein